MDQETEEYSYEVATASAGDLPHYTLPPSAESSQSEVRQVNDRSRRREESHEQREERLQRRRASYRQRILSETPEQREERLQHRRETDRLRHRQDSAEHRQHLLATRRYRNKTLENFKADIQVTLDCCMVCYCLTYEDKVKEVSIDTLTEVCPTDFPIAHVIDPVLLCSKCHTHILRAQWPPWSTSNNLLPDKIPIELAALSPDEVRTISLICPFLKVVILPGGQFGEEGSVIHFPFPVQHVMTQLPRPLSESELILSSVGVAHRETFATLLQQVDHHKVYTALLWLRTNNPLYTALSLPQTIPNQPHVLSNQSQTLPHQSPCATSTANNTQVHNFTESCVIPQNYVDPDIPIEQLLQQQNTAPLMPFPRIASSPVNMFQQEQLEEHAFPVLYPKGRFGLGYNREKHLTDLKYFQARLFNKDSRWRDNVVWMFWALNTFEMRKLQNQISILSRIKKQNNQPLTAGDIVNPTTESLSQSYMFMKNIRGTAAYWKDQLLDLLARINTLGPPTFFLTLTANDLHWPELFTLINPTLTYDAVALMSSGEKLELLRRHPLEAVMFFERRLDSFLKNVIMGRDKPLGTVKDYWLRIEFQMRGSPHVHSFWWIEGAPKVDTVEGRQHAPQFIDQYISTMLPDQSEDPELHRLVSSLQVHRHSSTCYKHNRVTCRFNYPRPPSDTTRLRTNTDPGSAAQFYVTQRNECDQWVNAYNPTLLKTWQANMDIQMVGSQYGAAMYVCMYVSKSEPERLKHAMHETLQNIPPNASQRKRLSMIGATVLTHRQVSLQEVVYRLGGFSLVRSTRTTVTVNSRYPQNRSKLLKPKKDLSQLPDQSTHVFEPGTIDYYQNRPDGHEWDLMSLATFATHYTTTGKQSPNSTKLKTYDMWAKKRQKPACLRLPHLTPASGDEYYYSLLVLFKPFRQESEIIHDGESPTDAFVRQSDSLDTNSSTFLNMAQQIQEAIVRIRLQDSSTPLDIAAQVAPNLTSLENTQSDLHVPPEMDDDYLTLNATMLASTSPPRQSSHESPTLVDESLSWHQISQTTMSDTEYQHALNHASLDQKVVIDMIFSHNRNRLLNNNPEQLLLFVTGGAGVGKSYLIRTVKEMLIRTQHNSNPVLLTAPTGIASHNISGITVHSAFNLPVEHRQSAKYIPLKAEKLKQFRTKFKDIAYVIIDEISMVSCHNFDFVHKRLCEIKDTTHDSSILFGGLSVIVFGDLFQLKPVHGCYIFDTRKPESYLWQKFGVGFLTTNHRQADDKTWADILNRIRIGQPTDADIDLLHHRTTIDTSTPPFDSALRIYPTRKQVKEYNEERLTHLTSSHTSLATYSIPAIDSCTSTPAYLTDEQIQESLPDNESETAGLTQTLKLAQGSRVMLIRNVYTDEGLVNGAQGTVQGPEWGDDHHTMPRGIYVKFDNPSIGRSLKNPSNHQYREAILIRPITANFYGKFNVHWSRTQIPLTPCWATTVHKVQGITLSHAVIDIGPKVFASGMSYVALSRVTNIQGLAILSFDPTKLRASEAVMSEMSRLANQ